MNNRNFDWRQMMKHRMTLGVCVLGLCLTCTGFGIDFQNANMTENERFIWCIAPTIGRWINQTPDRQGYMNSQLTTDLAAIGGRITSNSDFMASSYNRNLNLLFACASKDVYMDRDPDGTPAAPDNTLRKEGFRTLQGFWWGVKADPDNDDYLNLQDLRHTIDGYVVAQDLGMTAVVTEKLLPNGKRVIAIGFKGSSEVLDWAYNFLAMLQPFYGTRAHTGFKLQMEEFMDTELIVRCSDGRTLADWITTEGSKPAHLQNTRFIIYGHSLGGAVAQLYAATLAERGICPKLLTYGAPPAGPQDFVDCYKDQMEIYEFVHRNDPVAQLVSLGTVLGEEVGLNLYELVTFPGRYYYQIGASSLYGTREQPFDLTKLVTSESASIDVFGIRIPVPDTFFTCAYYHAAWLYIQHAAEDRVVSAGSKDAITTAASMDLFDDMMN